VTRTRRDAQNGAEDLSPITLTPEERQARNAADAQGAFIAKKAEMIDAMLARLQSLSDAHFEVHPNELTWADVGTLGHYAELLRGITDCAFREGEHAEIA
jgi:hypothetical protein